eukprot:c12289_g2_i1.p1 GENE.c12289_g2_i1~~c12289_g2_i1.p1  ORF type:complete len:1157 (+),score=273.31 c12289_g2_i1:119-3589(+)
MLLSAQLLLLCGLFSCAWSKESFLWSYVNSPSSTLTCGASEEIACGPNKWGTVFAECALENKQSPINVDVAHIHASHELDELRWIVSECSEATVTLGVHHWQVELGAGCSQAFKLSRFGHTYYATTFEFHSPSEHTFDAEHLSLEVQIKHQAGNHHLTVAVVLEAEADFVDNSFLAGIWKVAQKVTNPLLTENDTLPTFPATSLAHNFSRDSLNFVDNLLPSRGLSFDYVLYEGSATSPDCAEMQWVVLKNPGRMSVSQLDYFLSTMVSVNDTKARPDGSNNRLVQDLGHRELELYQDADCYIRFCHQIFSLGSLLSFPFIGFYIVVLIIFTMMFESLSNYAEHKVEKLRTAREMLAKVHKELSVLGLVSFLTFAINSTCAVSFHGTGVEFEFAHIMLFAVAILYVLFSGMLMVLTSYASTQWDKVLLMKGQELVDLVESPRYLAKPTAWLIFGRISQTLDLGVFYCHHLFMQQHNLPEDFDFLKYLKYCLSNSIKQQLDIGSVEWIRMIFILGFWGIVGYFGELRTMYGPIGVIFVMIVFATWILCILSFKRLLKLLNINTHEALKNKVRVRHTHKTQANSIISMLQTNESTDNVRQRLQTMLTPRKLSSKNSLQFEMDKAKSKELMKRLQKCWVPGGSPALIRTLADSALLTMCFYAGFFALNARSYLSGFQSFLTVSSIIAVVCVLLPSIYLTYTVIGSLVEPNFDLIGEVLEYTEELQLLRTNLVDTLFPELDMRLLSDMTQKEAEDLVSYFDMDGDCEIDIPEFGHGCQMLGLRMSESKARRFFRMVDVDRNGIIDADELFTIIFEERLARIDKNLVQAFRGVANKKGSADTEGKIPEKIPQKDIFSALKKTFRSDDNYSKDRIHELSGQVTAELVKTNPNFESQPEVHILELRQALVRVLSSHKLNIQELLEVIKSKRKHLNKLQVWAMRASQHDILPKRFSMHSAANQSNTFATRNSAINFKPLDAADNINNAHIKRRNSLTDVKHDPSTHNSNNHRNSHKSDSHKSDSHKSDNHKSDSHNGNKHHSHKNSNSDVQARPVVVPRRPSVQLSFSNDRSVNGAIIGPMSIPPVNTTDNFNRGGRNNNNNNRNRVSLWQRLTSVFTSEPVELSRTRSSGSKFAHASWRDDDFETVANTIPNQTPMSTMTNTV